MNATSTGIPPLLLLVLCSIALCEKTIEVSARSASVYLLPNASSDTRGAVRKGQRFPVEGENERWYRISLYGSVVWIEKDSVKPATPGIRSLAPVEQAELQESVAPTAPVVAAPPKPAAVAVKPPGWNRPFSSISPGIPPKDSEIRTTAGKADSGTPPSYFIILAAAAALLALATLASIILRRRRIPACQPPSNAPALSIAASTLKSVSVAALEGDLAGNLPDILQFIETGRKSGCLLIETEGAPPGRIYFQNGRVIFAEAVPSTGREAISAMLGFNQGIFRFIIDKKPKKADLDLSTIEVLMEWTRIQDEAHRR